MVTPPFLKAGDKVGIGAPGRKISPEDFKAAANMMSPWGIEVIQAPNLFSNAHNYLAGTDAERSTDLQILMDNPNIKAIICARGGYGTTRILDDLDFSGLLEHPKWIVGFSDITALHLRLAKLGVASAWGGDREILFERPVEDFRLGDEHRLLAKRVGPHRPQIHSVDLHVPRIRAS